SLAVNATQLYQWKYFPLNNHTELDLLRRVWSLVELCLDNVYIQTRGGEKTNMASSSRKNESRVPAGVAPMKRKAIGRRGDLIFVKGGIEVGCGELGKVDSGAKGTKEMKEGFLKAPKMMKDQLAALINKRPDQFEKLRVVGFISMGLSLQVLVMDCPFGNICRIRRITRVEYPQTIETYQNEVIPMYELILIVKEIMISNIKLLEAPTTSTTIGFAQVISNQFR
ncbi:hypothetical protein BDC45DRAFT_437975, partial [Circinella umbellata]